MVACAVINCRVRSGQGYAMFKFPDSDKDSERRAQWIDSIQLVKYDFEPASFARVCERHFQSDQFVVDPSLAESIGFQQKKLRLKENAVPTIFTHFDDEDRLIYKNRDGIKKLKRRPRKRKKIEESEDSDTYSSSDTEPYDPTDYNVPENDPEQLTEPAADTHQTNSTSWMKPKRGIRKKVICALARKNAAVAPTFVEKRNLAANGLGDKVVEFPEDGTIKEVKFAIQREFPQLADGFDFVRTQGKTRHLFPVASLDVNKLFNLELGDGNLYARPIKLDIDIDKNLVYEKDGSSLHGVCKICGKSLPMDGIENHVKHCQYFNKEKQARDDKNRNKFLERKVESNDIKPSEVVMDVSVIKQENPGNINIEYKPALQPQINPSPASPVVKPKCSYSQIDDTASSALQPTVKSLETDKAAHADTDQKLDEKKRTRYERTVSISTSLPAIEREMLLTLKDREHIHNLGLNLYGLQKHSVACDLLLSGKDNCTIFAHKVVFLASGSSFLKDVLLQNDKNKNFACTIINFPLYPYHVLEALVRYVYTGDILVPIRCAESFFMLCGSLQFYRVQELMKPYLTVTIQKKELSPLAVSITSSPDEKKIIIEQTTKLPLKSKKTIFNPPKKLSEKLRDIMQKNEELFNDVGINSNLSTKVLSKTDSIEIVNDSCVDLQPTSSRSEFVNSHEISKPSGQDSVMEVLDNSKGKSSSSCQMFVKTSSFNSDVSDDMNNCVSDSDITVKTEPMYAIVENVEQCSLDTNQFLAGNSSDKFLASTDYVASLKTVSPRRVTLMNEDQIENELMENSSNFHSEYVPTIVIKTEPPSDYEDWQNKNSLGLDLPVVSDNNEGLGSVTIKEEPMT